MSWRDHLKIHPAADLFPLMSEPELRELGENIKANGLLTPIVVDGDELLDGRNRLDAIELVGMEFEFIRARGGPRKGEIVNIETADFDTGFACLVRPNPGAGDAYDFVIAANLHRRHLTSEKKRELIAKVLKAKPEASNAAVAKQTKTTDKTAAKVRSTLEARSEIPNVETRTDTKGRVQPARKKKAHPEVLSALADGTMGDACIMRSMEAQRASAEISADDRRAYYATTEELTVEDDLEVGEYREAFLLRAADALAFAVYSGEVDQEIISAAERVVAKWQEFTQKLRSRVTSPAPDSQSRE
jgi:hypothetical protein